MMNNFQSTKTVPHNNENSETNSETYQSFRKVPKMFGINSQMLNASDYKNSASLSGSMEPSKRSSYSSSMTDTASSTHTSNANGNSASDWGQSGNYSDPSGPKPSGMFAESQNHLLNASSSLQTNGFPRTSSEYESFSKNSPGSSLHRLSNLSINNNNLPHDSPSNNTGSTVGSSSHRRATSITNAKGLPPSVSFYNKSTKPLDWGSVNNGTSSTQDTPNYIGMASPNGNNPSSMHSPVLPRKTSGIWRNTGYPSRNYPSYSKSGIPPVPNLPSSYETLGRYQTPSAGNNSLPNKNNPPNIDTVFHEHPPSSSTLNTAFSVNSQAPAHNTNQNGDHAHPPTRLNTLSNLNSTNVPTSIASGNAAPKSPFSGEKSSQNLEALTPNSRQVHTSSHRKSQSSGRPSPKGKSISSQPNSESKQIKSSGKEGRSSRGGFFSRLSFSRSSSRAKKAKSKNEEAPEVPSIPQEYLKDGKKTPTRTKSRMQQLISWFKSPKDKPNTSYTPNSYSPPPPPVPRLPSTQSQLYNARNRSEDYVPPVPQIPSNFTSGSKEQGNQQRSVSYNPKRSSLNNDLPTNEPTPATAPLMEPLDSKFADLAMKAINSKRINRLLDEAKIMQSLLDRACKITPVKSSDVLLINTAPLTRYEEEEIKAYENIYFTGLRNVDKSRLVDETSTNYGFDDERGDYRVILGDHIAYRYEVVDYLGKGSFGQVLRCIDYQTGKLVALKIIRNKKRFHIQALVETKILQKIREWDPMDEACMLQYSDHFYFRDHLCVATELLGVNLYELIKSNGFKGLPIVVIKSITKQLLLCLTLLKQKNVIHCDLKPENILLCHPFKSHIKVIDFGSSCFEGESVYTYIQSRFYRSPEVILGMGYGTPIDMWSLGCILAEMYTGFPIFPGENEQEQLACIMEIFGPPDRSMLENCSRRKVFFDSFGKPRPFVSSKGVSRRPFAKSLHQVLECKDISFLSFIADCLRWDPEERMTPFEAIQHDFITGNQDRRPNTAPARQKIVKSPPTYLESPPSRPLPNLPNNEKTSDHVDSHAFGVNGQVGSTLRVPVKDPDAFSKVKSPVVSDNMYF
ncbi:DYRK family cell polarity protein kinase Pom1 [Schizosaccharomyces osmophilus]|uniref:DYRK family cell polarity protein kinase Pom1 n=1 Tax=Schizosaccharomyces osmophilus TaxID=2545709 RepID=A0AAE9WB80_9SCHI|nr:DYRK family cell polarity protein kinase Pom1 [Schizosaccharomyces osmophilus]WBW71408.1 DYRK family cell polarity protein kinase Pom1 [Schizosaccharomyces osmophilus]